MTILRGSNLEILVAGTTHVLERNGKEAFVYFDTKGEAHMLLDDGETRAGRWRLDDDGYVTDWDTGVTGNWTLDHCDGLVTYVNRDNGAKFRMIGILFGNAKKLPRRPT